MSQDFLRTKKNLDPLDSRRAVLHGFRLSFPAGRGIDFVEPSFATLKRDPTSSVHGVSTLLSRVDADNLDRQEGGYEIEVAATRVYETGEELRAEVYVPRNELPLNHPEGPCSERYRAVLVKGAVENGLDEAWIELLRTLPVYTPSAETLALRAAVPPLSVLPQMSIAELREHDGTSEAREVYTSACGYAFAHKPFFRSHWGRDVTFRNVLHFRGINLDANDDGGISPFPRLSQLMPSEREYALQNLDRLLHKAGAPIAVLRDFWEEQEGALEGVFSANTMSKLADAASIAESRVAAAGVAAILGAFHSPRRTSRDLPPCLLASLPPRVARNATPAA
eukprot:CAMPEP_0183356806 /NCGR_PEP_ID=MMETSP0164_2-20130417/45204_1 /TAXON_ID=221442 /ORGANISM="Coccolithus pelagicus ssp braarudi, Strain PLY182g" /LENGTH=336 /DNA_ID=CAMNT_0025530305 /DNA_START=8 /DNA_END=1016 /DNA_ORIENTATION=-